MKKQIASLLLCLLLICSCSANTSVDAKFSGGGDDYLARIRLEQVLGTIDDKDKDGLKSIFSKQALDKSADFESNANELFAFFQGKVKEVKKSSGPTVFDSKDKENVKKKISAYYYVTTDKQKYFVLFDDYPADTAHPDNVGLYLLLVVRAEDEYKIWDGSQKILFDGKIDIPRAGIYLPIK